MVSARKVTIFVVAIAVSVFTSSMAIDQLVTHCGDAPFLGALISSGGLVAALTILILASVIFLGQAFGLWNLPLR
jgi:hypothetical protein